LEPNSGCWRSGKVVGHHGRGAPVKAERGLLHAAIADRKQLLKAAAVAVL